MKKRILGILLSFALMLTMMPALGMSMTAYAISGPVSVSPEYSGKVDIRVPLDGGDWRLTAIPEDGSSFVNWSYTVDGSPQTSTDNPWYVSDGVISEYSDITANFNASVIKYPLWVGETRVDSDNKDDVLSDGTVSFTPADGTNPATLTLKGADITTSHENGGIYYNDNKPLTIKLESENTINLGEGNNGISCPPDLTIEGEGTLTINSHRGILCWSSLLINGSNVTATGTGDFSVGIIAYNNVTINDSNVTATGTDMAIYGKVKNDIAGTGWTDPSDEGSAEKIYRNTSEEGQDIKKYKKVQFPPAAASVTTKPEAKNLTENGSAQELVTAGTASGGEMQYALGKDATTAPKEGWSKSIPTGTNEGLYYVWYKAAGDEKHSDSKPACVTVTIAKASAADSGVFLMTMKAKGDRSVAIKWQKVNGADGYDIFFSRCNNNGKKIRPKKVKTIKGNKTFKWTKKGLKKGLAYKGYVKAYVKKNGKKTYVKTSPLVHVYTSGASNKYTNAKSLSLNRKSVSLKAGKSFKLRARVAKLKADKELVPPVHVAKVRYLSTDKKVATVSKSGKIKGVSKGTCYVYAYAHNGVFSKVKVNVK